MHSRLRSHFTGKGGKRHAETENGDFLFRMLGNVVNERFLITNDCGAGRGHNHGLGLPIQHTCNIVAEVINDEFNLLRHIGRMQTLPLSKTATNCVPVHTLVCVFVRL